MWNLKKKPTNELIYKTEIDRHKNQTYSLFFINQRDVGEG